MTQTIKCGRNTYQLQDGDTVMDNGSCIQLVSKDLPRNWIEIILVFFD